MFTFEDGQFRCSLRGLEKAREGLGREVSSGK